MAGISPFACHRSQCSRKLKVLNIAPNQSFLLSSHPHNKVFLNINLILLRKNLKELKLTHSAEILHFLRWIKDFFDLKIRGIFWNLKLCYPDDINLNDISSSPCGRAPALSVVGYRIFQPQKSRTQWSLLIHTSLLADKIIITFAKNVLYQKSIHSNFEG